MSDDTFARLVAQHAAKRQSAEAAEGLASFVEAAAAQGYPFRFSTFALPLTAPAPTAPTSAFPRA